MITALLALSIYSSAFSMETVTQDPKSPLEILKTNCERKKSTLTANHQKIETQLASFSIDWQGEKLPLRTKEELKNYARQQLENCRAQCSADLSTVNMILETIAQSSQHRVSADDVVATTGSLYNGLLIDQYASTIVALANKNPIPLTSVMALRYPDQSSNETQEIAFNNTNSRQNSFSTFLTSIKSVFRKE